MKTCLICARQEPSPGRRPAVDFICSACILKIVSTPRHEINQQYIQAIKNKAYGVAYALYTFTSRETRKKHPLKYRRR